MFWRTYCEACVYNKFDTWEWSTTKPCPRGVHPRPREQPLGAAVRVPFESNGLKRVFYFRGARVETGRRFRALWVDCAQLVQPHLARAVRVALRRLQVGRLVSRHVQHP